MRNGTRLKSVQRSAAARRAGWVLFASAMFVTACAAPPRSAAPTSPPAEAGARSPEGTGAESGQAPADEPVTIARAPRLHERSIAEAEPTQVEAPVKQSGVKPSQKPVTTQPATVTPASEKKSGCGDKGSAATPKPSPDGPQSLYVCTQPKITADPVWRGEKIDFVFEINNAGAGVLQIKIKGG